MTLLNGAKDIELIELDINQLKTNLDSINFTDIWTNISNIWTNVSDLLTFFNAIGETLKGVWDSIVNIGKMLYYTLEFIMVFITWITINFINITKFIIEYIFIQ